MKPQYIILFFLSAFVVMAVSAGDKTKGKVRSFYSSQDKDTMLYYYDVQGRLTHYTGAGGYKTSYEYKDKTIIQTTAGGSKVTMYLNGRGLVDSLTDIDPRRSFKGGSPQPGIRAVRAFPYAGDHVLSYLDGGVASRNTEFISKKFVYDAAGFLVQEKEYVNGKLWAISDNRVEGGNITSYTMKYFFSETATVVNPTTMKSDTMVINLGDRFFTLSYDPDKANTLAMDGPFGKCSKNLVIRSVDRSLPLTKDSTVNTFSYAFDNSSHVIRLSKTVKSNDPPEWNDDARLADQCTFSYY